MAETDDLVTRLLANGLDECDEAADRIMQLECLARGQEEQLEIQGNELARRASHGHQLAARIEALTAERDAKEAKLTEIRNLQAAPEGWDEVYATRALINERDAAIARAEAAEAALKEAAWLLTDAMVQLCEGKIRTRRNRALMIRNFLDKHGEQP